jgi:hypothetical protein
MFNDQAQLGFRRSAIFGVCDPIRANVSVSIIRAKKRRLGSHATQPAKTRY